MNAPSVLACLPLAGLAVGALAAAAAPNVAAARRRALGGALAALAASLIGLVLPSELHRVGFGAAYVTLILLVNVVAVGMSPLDERVQPAAFARMLLVSGLSCAIVLSSQPGLVAALWCAQALVVFAEVRGTPGLGRVFLAYQALSCLAFVAAVALARVVGWERAALPLLVAIGIREAIVPFHSWFPRTFERAPIGLVVVFSAPQLGVWLHLSLLSGHLDATLMERVAQFGTLTALLAALLGVFQTNPRRAVAYLFMSQSGLLTFGLESQSAVARAGTLMVWMGVGLAAAGLAMLLAALEARRGALQLHTPSGNLQATPRLGSAFLVLGLACVGLPGSIGFVSEDLVFQGAIHEFPVGSLALVFVTGINGLTVMRAFLRLFGGAPAQPGVPDLNPREAVLTTAILVCLFAAGWLPGPLLQLVTAGR